MLATVDNADYWPVVSRWTGSSFSPPQLTGDKNSCAPSSHDPVADASGRMADISEECEDLAVANLTDTLHAAVVRFPSGGTIAGASPQLATAPRGHGWASGPSRPPPATTCWPGRCCCPGATCPRRRPGRATRRKLTGPASCLPPVGIAVKAAGTPAAGWTVTSSSLALDGNALSGTTLDGATLTAGTSHTLTGTVTFTKGGTHLPVTATLKFTSCPNP